MQRWNSKREMMGDDPPYLAVGTEVSAKYKGAFCEAEVRKVVRSVKCKVAFKLAGLGNATVTDDQIRGTLRAGSNVEVKHPEKKEFVEATITKIQDCSQYTVVFDDGDITTLRRTALCLKSGRHFAESETLDQLPLTHPEHFGNPVIGGRRGRRNRDDSSDDDESSRKGKQRREEKEADIGKVVCVEISEKKKQKDNWFPGLVVAPTAQDTVRIHVKEEYLVRSFKDGRYYTVPKKEATSFTREIGSKVDNNTLRTAVDKALLYLDKDELPPHWDRELLFGLDESSESDSDAAFDSDSSDNEPREEKDHFVAQLYKFMDDRGTPINKGPTIATKDVDLYKLFMVVQKLGGYNRVTNHNQWKTISHKLGFGQNASTVNLVKHAYKKFLHSFEDFYRKLGCTMISHPRNNRARHRSNRSLIRDRDRATPKSKEKGSEKESDDPKESTPLQDTIKKEEVVKPPKEEEKPKEIVETPKRESRSKEVLKTKASKEEKASKDEKADKKDDKATVQETVKRVEESAAKVKEEPSSSKGKAEEVSGGRPERSKERAASLKGSSGGSDQKAVAAAAAAGAGGGEDQQQQQQQKTNKVTNRRDTNKEIKAKQEEKEEDKVKGDRDNRPGSKRAGADLKEKKRSLFAKVVTSARRPRSGLAEADEKAKAKTKVKTKVTASRPSLGLAAVRQKRSFKERMKSIVRKFKFKGGSTPVPAQKTSPIIPPPPPTLPNPPPPSQPPPITAPPVPPVKPSTSSLVPPPPQVTTKRQSNNDATDDAETFPEINGYLLDDGADNGDDESDDKEDEGVTGIGMPTSRPIADQHTHTLAHAHAQPAQQLSQTALLRPKCNDHNQLDSAGSSKNVQLTRSKSREDMPIRLKKEPSNSDLKKSSSPQNLNPPAGGKEHCSDADKRRGRKRKDDEKGSSEEVLDQLPSYKSVSVGDKLKVYYGPTHESKVTYEAKVLSTKEEGETLYLVHYTGWNTRYDEWIKRSRIADNLSWSPGRVKRNRQPQQQSPKTSTSTKRGRSSDTGSSNGRSTTPSLTSPPSGRSKLPNSTRTYTRSKQSSRRISGHTDFSDSDSGDESDSESDAESSSPLQKRMDKLAGSSDEKDEMEIRTKRRAALAFAHTLTFESKDDKRKSIAPSTSEDERDLEKCKDESRNKTPTGERRILSRVSIEKELKEQSEDLGSGERRGRKLRSDRISRVLSDSEDDKEDIQEKDKKDGKRVSLEKKKAEDSKSKVEIKKETIETEDVQSLKESSKNIKSMQNEPINKEDSDELLASKLRSDRRKADSESVDKDKFDSSKSSSTEDTTIRSDRLRNRSDKRRSEAKAADETKMQLAADSSKLTKSAEEPDCESKPDIPIKDEPSGESIESTENKKKTRYEKRKFGSEKISEDSKDETSQDTDRNRRSRRGLNRKDDTSKICSSKDDSDEEQPKGRDFDLMQIRSELKGIDKAVKASMEMKAQTSMDVDVKEEPNQDIVVKKEPADVKIKVEETESTVKETVDLSADDIYEFKEPEPFEFEVRPKCSEEKGGKIQRRPFGRICDEIPKSPPLKRKILKTKPSPPETKKRFRRNLTKKDENPVPANSRSSVEKEDNQAPEKKTEEPNVKLISQLEPVSKLSPPLEPVAKPTSYLNKSTPTEEQKDEKTSCNVSEVAVKETSIDKTSRSESSQLQTKDQAPSIVTKPAIPMGDDAENKEKKTPVKDFEKMEIPDVLEKDTERKSDAIKVEEDSSRGARDIDDDSDDEDDDDGENRLVIFEVEEQDSKNESKVATTSSNPVEESKKMNEKEKVKSVDTITKELSTRKDQVSTVVSDRKEDNVIKMPEPSEESKEKSDVKTDEVDEIEEEEDDEAINAAIRRVIQQTDEESNDFDPLPPPVKSVEPPISSVSSSQILTSYKKDNKRRKVTISKEFIEDSDSDSDVEIKHIATSTSIATSLASLGSITSSTVTPIQTTTVVQNPVAVSLPSVLKTTLPIPTCAPLKGNFTLAPLQGSKIATTVAGLIKPLGVTTNPSTTKILLNLATPVHRPPLAATVTTTGHLPILTTIHKPPPLSLTNNPMARPCLSVLTPTVRPASVDPSVVPKPTLTVPILTSKPIISPANLPQTVANFTLLSSDIKTIPHLIPKPNFISPNSSIKPTPIVIASVPPNEISKPIEKDSEPTKMEEKCIRILSSGNESLKLSKSATESTTSKKEETICANPISIPPVKEEKVDEESSNAKNKKPISDAVETPVEQKIDNKEIEVVEETVEDIKVPDKVEKENEEEREKEADEEEEEKDEELAEETKEVEKIEYEIIHKVEDVIKIDVAVEEDGGDIKSEDEAMVEEEERQIMKEFDVAEEDTMEADEDEDEDIGDDDDDEDDEDDDVDDDEQDEEEEVEEQEEEECVQSLLCEEEIPGSPAPPTLKEKELDETDVAELPFASAPGTSLHNTSATYTKPIVQQAPHAPQHHSLPPQHMPMPMPLQPPVQPPPDTPPTTPDSSLSPISNSPRGERSGSSPGLDNDSTKSQRDSSEIDLDYTETNKMDQYSEEDSVCAASVPGATFLKKPHGVQHEVESSPSKKRRRSRKRSEETCKRVKLARRSPRNPAGSDSDDTSENSLAGSSLDLSSSRSPKPSKHNFYVQLDPELDGAQRIAVLQQKLQELRKTYMSLKTELAGIDRRRKKLRRREREEKTMKQEVQCS